MTAAQTLAPAAVSVRDISKRFGAVQALSSVSLDIEPGRFVSLLGPSGCGKTTLMRIIAGLDRQSEGRIIIAGKDLSNAPPHRRPVGMIFQRYALFPHMTVAENIGFALTLKGADRKSKEDRVRELLGLVKLDQFGERSIDQLSGGQAQRVALARALADSPPVLLLDEPMSALDLKLRQAMQLELRRLQRRIGATFLFVTHDQDEAMVMSDEIILMNNGRVVQRGAPEDVYRRPKTLFSARFLGEANLFHGQTEADGPRTLIRAGRMLLRSDSPPVAQAKAAWVCIRPEAIKLEAHANGSPASGEPNRATGRVCETIFQGAYRRYVLQVDEHSLTVQQPANSGGDTAFSEGDTVTLSWPDSAVVQIEDDADA